MSGQQGTTSSSNAAPLIVDPSLSPYLKSPATYRQVQEVKRLSKIKHLVVGALVIHYPSPSPPPPPTTAAPSSATTPTPTSATTTTTTTVEQGDDERPAPRVLLVQRAQTDSYPGIWEVPGGMCDDEQDGTVVAAAARELAEETGLEARAALGCVGIEKVRNGFLTVVTFLMEVDFPQQQQQQQQRRREEHSKTAAAAEGSSSPLKLLNNAVSLDPKEHSDFVWATEEEVRCDQAQGRQLKWRPRSRLKGTVLEGFCMAAEIRRNNRKP